MASSRIDTCWAFTYRTQGQEHSQLSLIPTPRYVRYDWSLSLEQDKANKQQAHLQD